MNKYFTIKVLAVIYVLMAVVDCQAMNDEFREDRLDKCIAKNETCSYDTCKNQIFVVSGNNPSYFTLRICDINKFELIIRASWFKSDGTRDNVHITTLDNKDIQPRVTAEECAGIGVYVYLNVRDRMTTVITKLGGRNSSTKKGGPIDIKSMEDFANYAIYYKNGSSYSYCKEDLPLEDNTLYIIIAAVAGVILVFGALIIFFAVKRSQNKRGGDIDRTGAVTAPGARTIPTPAAVMDNIGYDDNADRATYENVPMQARTFSARNGPN